jgi:DNA-binding response OmpR family regulator
MNTTAFCTRDLVLGAQLSDLLKTHGLSCELFPSESSLMRALRHRGGLELVMIDLGRDPSIEECVLSWLACRTGDSVPVMLMSAAWNAQKIATALDAGADDCVPKTFERVELVARAKALLRRRAGARPAATRIEVAGFELDQAEGRLVDRGERVDLTPREFALAWLFFSNRGARLTREAISLAIWGSDKEIASRTMEQHVYKLRKKIGLSAARGVVIRTTYGQGYQLDLCSESAPADRYVPAGVLRSRLPRMEAERGAAPLS